MVLLFDTYLPRGFPLPADEHLRLNPRFPLRADNKVCGSEARAAEYVGHFDGMVVGTAIDGKRVEEADMWQLWRWRVRA